MPNSIFKKVPVQVQNLSGFNCSHCNSFDAKVGTLVPVLCDPVIPNTHIDLDVACEVQLPPSVADFYGQIDARLEFFFVPYRVLWAGWRWFMVSQTNLSSPPNNNSVSIRYLPGLSAPGTLLGPGSLADMLGYKDSSYSSSQRTIKNALPFLAYQMVYDNWYRDSRLTSPIFTPVSPGFNASDFNWRNAPYQSTYTHVSPSYKVSFTSDVAELLSLRQRCWDRDYFTNATTQPQAGQSAMLQFNLNITGTDDTSGLPVGTAGFSISALRAANSLQQFEERNNLAGQRYADQIYARFGCYPADAVTDRPIYLGSKRFNIYKRNVYQQSNSLEQNQQSPFNGLLANKATSLGGFGNGRLGKFHATEHGFVFVMFSLVPQAVYSTGKRKYLDYNVLTDFPDPLLQGVGDQPIYQSELVGASLTDGDSLIFGYTQRFAEAKFMQDEVHGKLRDGQNLSMFQLQRTFIGAQSLGTSFVEIPTDYLDQVTYTEASVSDFGCWCQCYFDYKKVQPLAAYSLPTLGEPKDTHTQIINNGGTRL